ncbi:hypothetical protein cypCar_00019614 [Cyprinus carpio]|nr:hypothetical protein cypCar_00019614 [Cyprinus carpio]
MTWFGFGFDGFGQMRPAGVSGQASCNVNTPVLISDVCGSECGVRVRASWSSRADVHRARYHSSGSHVCVSGFVSGSSEEDCGAVLPESEGCTDALISERYLTLSFTDKVECWEIQHPQNKLVWKREQDNTGHAVALPLVSGGHGQLGHGALTSQEEPQVVEALWGVPIRAVSAGNWHSASVSRNTEQPINEDEKKEADVFISIQAFPALVDVPNVSEISSISCGSRHTAAVTGTGDLYTWGWGHYGQLGHGTENSTDEPTLVDYFPSHHMCVKDVICGLWNTFVSAVPKEQPPS